MEDMNPVAWLCEDLIFEGERSVIMKEDHAKARAARTDEWLVTPLYTLPAQAPAVKVKPLEWVELSDGSFEADSIHGCYLAVARHIGDFVTDLPKGRGWLVSETMDAAKAAAQADYEARILSALDMS